MIKDLSHMYWNLEVALRYGDSENQSSSNQTIVEAKQKHILKQINILGGNAMEKFKQFVPVVYQPEAMQELHHQIEKTMHQAFWDSFEQEIKDGKSQ